MSIILSIVGLVLLLIVVFKAMAKLADQKATRTANEYCKLNGLDFLEVKPFPNHYGLYFKHDGKRYYANFDFEMPNKITWKKGSPGR